MDCSEGLYMIHTREFYNTNQPIFKLGRSHNLDNRIKQYPKGSKIICMINCINSILYEKQLLSLFKDKFIQKLEYGSEYFEGDKNTMIREIFKFIDKMMKEEEDAGKVKEAAGKVKEATGKVKEAGKVKKAAGKVKEEAAGKVKEAGKVKDDKKICPKCNYDFKYLSLLKRHLKTSVRCISTDEYIDNHILTYNINKDSLFICTGCNKNFKYNTSLYKHIRISKCGKTKTLIK